MQNCRILLISHNSFATCKLKIPQNCGKFLQTSVVNIWKDNMSPFSLCAISPLFLSHTFPTYYSIYSLLYWWPYSAGIYELNMRRPAAKNWLGSSIYVFIRMQNLKEESREIFYLRILHHQTASNVEVILGYRDIWRLFGETVPTSFFEKKL